MGIRTAWIAGATAVCSAMVSLAVAGSASAVPVYVNNKGLKASLVKASMMPAWLGQPVASATIANSSRIRPILCVRSQDAVTGMTARSSGQSSVAFAIRRSSATSFVQRTYQYSSARKAEAAWRDVEAKLPSCAGTQVHVITDNFGTVIGRATVTNTLTKADEQYGVHGWVLEEDVSLSGQLPDGASADSSADSITIIRLRGAALIAVTLNKFVAGKSGWVFNEAELATIDALSHVATSRYSHIATKSL